MGAPRKPPALIPGQTIGLIAPSFAVPKPAALAEAIETLESLGYRVKAGGSCSRRHGYFAGPDSLRVADINRMFRDDSVDAIFCARGGYGATRLLERVDYDAIRANPKIFSGYSDVTALHGALQRRAGLVTFHGLMATADMAKDKRDDFSLSNFFRVLTDPAPIGLLENPPNLPRVTIAPGRATGRLIGGNLSLVAGALGTPYAYDFNGAILFLEDVGEKTYAIDRLLTQLARAGALDRVAGILLGHFADCVQGAPEHFTMAEVMRELLDDLGKPVLGGIQCGHCVPKLTLPLGVLCRMDAGAGTVEVLEGAVEGIRVNRGSCG